MNPVNWPWRMAIEQNNPLGSLGPLYLNNPPGHQPFDDWAANMIGETLDAAMAKKGAGA